MAIREGKWRCPYCAVANRGAAMACTGCGATRDKDVTFFLEDDAEEVTDALIARARAGADWLCTFCGASNPPERDHCRNCGAQKGTAPSRPVREVAGANPAPVAALPVSARFRPVAMAILLVLVAFVVAAAYFGLRRTEETLTVPDRTVRASGLDHAAHWPDPQLRTGEREASRAEKLVVLLSGKRTYRMELPESRWAVLQPGQAVSAVIRGGWSVRELK